MTIRRTVCAGLCILFCSVRPAGAQDVYSFDLPRQPLAESLRIIAIKTGMNILFNPSDVKARMAATLQGQLSVQDALERVLARSGLESETTTPSTIIIRPANRKRAAAAEKPASAALLEEIVVTAQKREELLQTVPVPVTVMNTTVLADHSQFRVQDYASQVPGLALTPNQFNGSATVAIRGISSGDINNPTVGATVDDVAVGSSTSIGGGYVIPDLDPGDLSRIEILRGPQGTLYGASSIGGLFKYVTVAPTTEATSGYVRTGVQQIYSGDSAGYSVSAGANIALNDEVAIRGSAFTRQSPGYISNVQDAGNKANMTRLQGGQLATLWNPSEQFSVKLSALYQDDQLLGHPYVSVQPGLGDLEQQFLPGTGTVERKFKVAIATVKAKTNNLELTSVTGYSVNTFVDRLDYSVPNGAMTQRLFGTPYTINTDDNTTYKFSQELRLAAVAGSHAEWLLGGYYTREYSPYASDLLAADAAGNVVGLSQTGFFSSVFVEWAEFVNLTYHFSEQFDIQLGGRNSQIRQTYQETASGPLMDVLGGPLVIPESEGHAQAFTYVVTPRLRLSQESMVYARLASGYRPGGINPGNFPGISPDFKPDRTRNYELGIKTNLIAQTLSLDASVYRIDWQDLQLSLTDPVSTKNYFTNGSQAKSEGIELSALFKPTVRWQLSGWVSYDNAKLTKPMPLRSSVYAQKGDRLPYSSRLSASGSADYQFPMGRFTASYGGTLSYVGSRSGTFVSVVPDAIPERQQFPAYVRVDLRTRLKRDAWAMEFYANNLADRRGVVGGGVGTQIPTAFALIQPRTFGVSLSRTFQ